MKQPLQVTFHGIARTDALLALVEEKAAKLEEFCGDIMSCRVAVESPHKHKRKGEIYRVRIDIRVPGEEIVVGRHPDLETEHADLYLAINEAFHAARRRLQDYGRERRRQVKTHEAKAQGRVERLFPADRYGFLRTRDEREVYFHANSLLNCTFDDLLVGTEAAFTEESGMKGPQASSIMVDRRTARTPGTSEPTARGASELY